MSEACDGCGRYFFDYGDRVRLVQNKEIKGQVIGERDWETQYLVRFAANLASDYLDHVEIEPDPDFEVPGGSKATLPAEAPDEPIGTAKIINLADVRAAGRA